MADRDTTNLRRLAAYEEAQARGAKSAISRERLDLAREKFDFDQTFKAAENERKIQESAMRVQQAEQRSTIAEKQLGLQAQAQELRDLQNEVRLKDAERATQDKIGFLKATRDLREDDEAFDQKMADAMAQFPNSSKDEMIQKRVGWMLDQRKGFLERTQAKPKSEGTISTTEDEAGKITTKITRPFSEEEATRIESKKEKEKLENQHSLLVGELNDKKSFMGKPNPGTIAKINEVKQKLGYDLLDENGQPIPKKDAVPVPVVSTPASTEIPTLTDRSQFDSLPSGSKYYRDGKLYQKP